MANAKRKAYEEPVDDYDVDHRPSVDVSPAESEDPRQRNAPLSEANGVTTIEEINALRFSAIPYGKASDLRVAPYPRGVVAVDQETGDLYATGPIAEDRRVRVGRPFKRDGTIMALCQIGVIDFNAIEDLEREDRDTKVSTARRILEEYRSDLQKFKMDLNPQQVKALHRVVEEG